MRDEDGIDKDLLDAWEAPAPPADLADRVLRALSASAPAPEKRRRPLVVVAAAGALLGAAALLVLFVRRGGHESAGAAVATARRSVRVGGRATAVAEPGATLSWRVDEGGAARVEQPAGDVFYRVDPGGPFVVATPAGDVTVLGTCFRVEVDPMRPSKQSLTGAAVGAAAAAIVVVSVYEGKVLFANTHGGVQLAAGDRALGRGDSVPVALPDQPEVAELAAPAANASREELLRRDEEQRRELAILRDRVKRMEAEARPGGKGGMPGEGRPTFVDTPKEELLAMAEECRLGYDTPPLHLEPFELRDLDAEELELTPAERSALRKRLDEYHTQVLGELRALYIEVTGDRERADELSPTALAEEIVSKSPRQEQKVIFQRLSRERAGLAEPPADLRGTSPAERYYRLMTGMGDDFERELAAVIGADRAHALRKDANGWGAKSIVSAGCPK